MQNKHIRQRITETLEKNYMPYAMSVIVSRAIPEIDGFKPSHRKILYTMYKMNLLKGKMTKSANVVGQTMKLNPHGDQAIYQTMVRLSRGHDALLHPYIESKGNFGKRSSKDMKYAASRYTEVKLAEISNEIFKDIDKNTVEFVDNYDSTMKEPTLLPTTFPNILVNNNMGIAVGMASNISSFNLKEVCETTIKYIDDREINLLDYLKAPDFSTGGEIIYDEVALNKIYNTGRGSITIRGRYRYVKEDNCIEIFEIPYTTTIEAIIDKIVILVKDNKIDDIKDIRDETDLGGLRVTIDLKRGKDPEILMGKLFNKTPLQDKFNCNFNMLINGAPMQLGVKKIIDEWLIFRKESIRNKLQFEIDMIEKKLHLLGGLEKVLLDLDKAIEIIRNTKNDKNVVPNIMENFQIDEIQAEFVVNIKLRNINKEYILNKVKEIKDLKKSVKKKNGILKSNKKINEVIKAELEGVSKKYGRERRSEIVFEKDIIDIKPIDTIKDYNVEIFLTNQNYFKKISLASLRSSGEHKLKDEDKIIQSFECSNKDEILLFSDKQKVYKRYLYEIDDHKTSKLGIYLPNILEMEKNETIIYMVPAKSYKGHMIFGFRNGKVQKLPLNAYETKTNRRYLRNAYSDKAEIVGISYLEEDKDLMMLRYSSPNDYRILVINSSLIPEKVTRRSSGVMVLRLKKDSEMLKMRLLEDVKIENIDKYYNTNIPRSGVKVDQIDLLKLLNDELME